MTNISKARLQQIADELKKPRISIRKIEEEAGLHQGTIQKILSGKLTLTDERIAKLLPILKKYNLL